MSCQREKGNLYIPCGFSILSYDGCKTRFDSDSLMAAKIATKNDRFCWNLLYKLHHYTSYRSCLSIYGITIVKLLSFLFLGDFEGDANISAAVKFGFTVYNMI